MAIRAGADLSDDAPAARSELVRSVVVIDGITLEVEPETGGAEDYRERARRKRAPQAAADAP